MVPGWVALDFRVQHRNDSACVSLLLTGVRTQAVHREWFSL